MGEKKWKVYVHVNKTNGKMYFGITSKPKVEQRWRNGDGYKENTYFYSAVQKYGWDGFNHIVLFNDLSEDFSKELECALIKRFNTNNRLCGYNLTTGGDGTPGYYPSEETRKKLSVARMKENLSEETLKRRSEGLRGRKFSEEHKRKIGIGNSKKIRMLDKLGNVLRIFDSVHEAEKSLGISHSHISQCCHGTRLSSGGYCWEFA